MAIRKERESDKLDYMIEEILKKEDPESYHNKLVEELKQEIKNIRV